MADEAVRTARRPLRLSRVLVDEHRHIYPDTPIDDPGDPETQTDEDVALSRVFEAFHRRAPVALCLSGGGIRSATFGLGVIQGLARRRMLGRFHYLSTVSGGGYIGSWLSAWVHRTGRASVETLLAAKAVGTKTAAESTAVDHLRNYSNYLTPRLGLLSADTWAVVATILRNLLLNWMILLPILATVVVVPQLWWAWLVGRASGEGHVLAAEAWAGVALVSVAAAIAYIELDLPGGGNRRHAQPVFLWCCLLPLTVAAALLTDVWAWLVAMGLRVTGELGGTAAELRASFVALAAFAVIGTLVHVLGWAVGAGAAWWRPGPPLRSCDAGDGDTTGGPVGIFLRWLGVPLSGAIGGAGLWVAAHFLSPDVTLLVCVGPPMLLTVFFLAMILCIGLLGGVTTEGDREWWARSGGWILIVALAWLCVNAASLYGPELPAATRAAVASLGGLSGIAAWLAAQSAKTPSGRRPDDDASATPWLDWIVTIGAPLFLIVLIVALAWLAYWAPRWLLGGAGTPTADAAWWLPIAYTGLLLTCATICAVASATVDVNRFSLHAMYRNRLVRSYLGASRPRTGAERRDPHPFTGFDEGDDLPLAALQCAGPDRRGAPPAVPGAAAVPSQLPFHVVNVALNLVTGARLAWQQRKAASFTFSPLHGGSAAIVESPPGSPPDGAGAPRTISGAYQPMASYGGARGVTLGTALAISGAAVSPNAGYHSSPVVTFLLALFNARLGWWLANPAGAGCGVWNRSGPRFALWRYLAEAFGLTNDRSRYVYLSDGGHFENLGLYEMVLRRCHEIVVVDAGCDPGYAFDDLGNAIRKIRIDLGISITFNHPLPMRREIGVGNQHVAQGTIHYADADGDGAPPGQLSYVKPVLSGDETVDIRNYRATHPTFPHETTADQWFDEDQFEAYRMLGLHSIDQWCAGVQGQPARATAISTPGSG